MQLLAIGLAASLVLGSAPQPEPAPETGDALPDVDAPADAEPAVEPAPEPEPALEPEPVPEPEPAVTPEPPAPTVVPSPETPEPPPVRDNLGCAGSSACRKMSIAGIAVGVVGLAAVGTGIGLLVKDDEVLPETPTFVNSTHPAGLVAATIGAGVTLTAVLMLVAAHKGYKPRNEQARVIPMGLRF